MYKKPAIYSETRLIQRKQFKFLKAAKAGELEIIQQLLLDPIIITPQTNFEALELAVEAGHLEIVKELLHLGKVTDVIDYRRSASLLEKAIRCDRLKIAKELLQIRVIKAMIAQGKHCRQIVRMAIKHGCPEIIKELMVASFSYEILEEVIKFGGLELAKKSLPIEAIKRDMVWGFDCHQIVRITIEHNCSELIKDLATASSSYNTYAILKELIKCGHLELAKDLLQIEAIKIKLAQGYHCRQIIKIAIKYAWSEIIRELAEASSSYNAYEILEELTKCGHLELAKDLLQIEAIKKEMTKWLNRRKIIETAIISCRPEVVRELLQIDVDVMGKSTTVDDSLNKEITRLKELETAIKLGYPEGIVVFLQEKSYKITTPGNYIFYFLTIAIESKQAEVLEALLLLNVIATHQIIARDHFLLKKALEKGHPGTIFALMKLYKSSSIKLPTNISIPIKRGAKDRNAMIVEEFYTDYSLKVNRNLMQYFPTVLTQMIATYCDISPNVPKPLTPLFSRPSNQTRSSRSLSLIPSKSAKLPVQVKPKQATTGSKQLVPEVVTWFLSISWTRVAGDPNKMRSNKMPLKKAEKFKEFLKKANENPYHFTRVASGSGTFQFEVSKKVLSESLKRLKTSETETVPKRYVRK